MTIARSATGWMVSVSVALLFAGVGSVTPAGAATLATLTIGAAGTGGAGDAEGDAAAVG